MNDHPAVPEQLAAAPEPFAQWFAARGWQLRRHQAEMLDLARQGRDTLLIAPTGGGKTLGGFLPSLVELHERGVQRAAAHALRLAAQGADHRHRAQSDPAGRGDGSGGADRDADRRHAAEPARAAADPSAGHAADHAGIAGAAAVLRECPRATSRACAASCSTSCTRWRRASAGRCSASRVARLRRLAPQARFVGLSATVAVPARLQRYLSPRPDEVAIVQGDPGAEPRGRACCCPRARCPGPGTWRSMPPGTSTG